MQKDGRESLDDYLLKTSPEEEKRAREEYRRRREQIRQSGYASRSNDTEFLDKIVADECKAIEKDKDAKVEGEKLSGSKPKKKSVNDKGNAKEKIGESETQNHREEDISVSEWFLTLCWSQIPIIGFLYMVITACRKNVDVSRRNYAKAYVLFRLLILFLAFCILYGAYRFGMNFVDGVLSLLK